MNDQQTPQIIVDPQAAMQQIQQQEAAAQAADAAQLASTYDTSTPQVAPSVSAQSIFAQAPQALSQALTPEAPAVQPTTTAMPAQAAEFEAPAARATQPSAAAAPAQSKVADTVQKAYEMQTNATRALGEYQAKKFEAQANERAALDKQLLEQQARMTKLREDMDAQASAQLNALKEFKVTNPWESKSTGQKIVAGIAMVLGGLSGSLTRKYDNPGYEAIKEAIDRDIELQKANYQNKTNLYKMTMDKYQNQLQAETASRILLTEAAANRVQMMADKYSAPEVKAKAQQLIGELQMKAAEDMEKFRKAAQANALLGQIGMAGQTGDLPMLSPQQLMALPKEQRDAYMEQRDLFVPGYGIAANKQAANEFQKFRGEVEPAITGANRILSQLKDFNKITDLKQRGVIATEMQALIGQLRLPFLGPGAMTEKEFDRLRDTLGNPAKLASIPEWEKAKLQTVLRKLQIDLQTRAKQAGLRPQTSAVKTFKPAQ